MRLTTVLLETAAALSLALLLFACPSQAQTITNTAYAKWNDRGTTSSTASNTVDVDIATDSLALSIFHPVGGGTTSIPVRAPLCGGRPLEAVPGSGGTDVRVDAEKTDTIRIGETLIIRVAATYANIDPSAVDTVTAVLTTSTGEREVLTLFETGKSTGWFSGAIRTASTPNPALANDCRLSVTAGENITVAIGADEHSPALVTSLVAVLADPFGFVFDSEDGTPIDGARVTLVNAASGQPAVVFADDGVTPWPSTVISGQPITDAAGNVYVSEPGEFRFPLAPQGSYRLVIEPPAPYTAPSEVGPAGLAGLARPDGGTYLISDASYGQSFQLSGVSPVRVDIPVDRPNVAVSITKTASRTRAQPGDAVFYAVTLRNQDPNFPKQGVSLVDLPSPALRLRPDSIRLDGQIAPAGTLSISADGRQMVIAIPTLAPGSSSKVTYAMVVRADASPGQAVNRATATDPRGGEATAEAAIKVERDVIASRMTIIGRVTLGSCSVENGRPGIPGVRVMLEDGSFAITDRDGRYHFEGVVPGTHVVQVQRQTLPEGGTFIDCDRSTRTAGSSISRFITGQGGSLAVADFAADVPGWSPPLPAPEPTSDALSDVPAMDDMIEGASFATDREAAGGDRDWLAEGDGPTDFLFPEADHNPRAPAIRVVIRHEADETVELLANGKPVDALAKDGTRVSADRAYAVTIWRGIPLGEDVTHLKAIVRAADGSLIKELRRDVSFVSAPWRAEILRDRSQLVADGKSHPVIAVRLLDRRGRPVRSGVSGSVGINDPYESAALLNRLQLAQLGGQGTASPNWTIEGDDGVALIELAPTMVSGPLHLTFNFADRDTSRRQEIDGWIVPGDLDWTVIGLAEGSIGEKTIADNMERTARFASDLGNNGRVALYAKGRVLGKFLMTLAYDSAKQADDQRLLGTVDPNAYYTVFADRSDRRYDAASREKLYLRIETATFYALYGDFVTGFDQTVLGRYQRTATGVKAEGRLGAFHAQGFAAKIATRYRRDEIQGNGLTGPYRLSDRNIVANSERVAIEVRDRFRSEIVVERRELMRFVDYDLDMMSGTITFTDPVLSRDFDLNPQFIVIDYEVDERYGDSNWNAGVRADYSIGGDTLRVGVTGISDKGDGPRTDVGSVDLRARIAGTTEIRAEAGMSRTDGKTSNAWLIEAEHRTGSLDILAYARSLDSAYGTGQQTGAELGRRKIGLDARYALAERFSLTGSAWYEESLSDASSRRVAQLTAGYRNGGSEYRLGIAHFSDRLTNGTSAKSTVLEGSATQRLLDNRLEIGASTSVALDATESIDLPTRHRLQARYAVNDWIRLVGNYEIAKGETIDARTFNGGVELSPWQGSRVLTTLGQQDIGEYGKRTFAAYGLAQTFTVTPNLSIDATVDGNRTLSGANFRNVINPGQPVASGGHLSQEGSLFEDFTALTLGASWRKDRWSASVRGEYRDGEFTDRRGVTAGIIRQVGEGIIIGSGFSWTRAEAIKGTTSKVMEGAVSAAYRPAGSPLAFLGKLEYRSDSLTGSVAGEAIPASRSALIVDGDAKARRLVASLSTNWSPRGMVKDEMVRRTEVGLFLGARYNFDRFEGYDLAATTVIGGLDARFGIGPRFEVGASATVRTNLDDTLTSFSIGPNIGFAPAKDTLVTIGYNIAGFRDPDFSAARSTDEGIYASVKIKFDADSFSFLGLGGR